jgi:hypothetical protein
MLPGVNSGAVGWGTALQAGRSWVHFPMVSSEFFIDVVLPATQWPWGQLSLYKKWAPGLFPRGLRQPVRRADNLTTFMCQLSWNLGASTSWNLQDLSRPVQGLIYLYLSYVTTLKKKSVLINNVKEHQFSVASHWLLFRMTPTLLYAQLCASSILPFQKFYHFTLCGSWALWYAAVVLTLHCRILWNMYSNAVDTLFREL